MMKAKLHIFILLMMKIGDFVKSCETWDTTFKIEGDILLLSNRNIKCLDGLERHSSLIEIDLSMNEIANIQSLSYLNELKLLFLSNNQINKIDSLRNLT